MPTFDKAYFDTNYSIRVLIPNPGKNSFARSPVRLHYHRAVMESTVAAKWDKVVPILGITSADRVVVVGAGFGWGLERLVELTGCTAVGIDTSPYIHAEKNSSEEADIDAAIIAAGFDPLVGHGLLVKNTVLGVKNSATVTILDNDLSNNKKRKDLKAELNDLNPTWVISEDMLSDFTDAEVGVIVDRAHNYVNAQFCHILRENFGLNPHTLEEWNALTGDIVIGIGDYRRVG